MTRSQEVSAFPISLVKALKAFIIAISYLSSQIELDVEEALSRREEPCIYVHWCCWLASDPCESALKCTWVLGELMTEAVYKQLYLFLHRSCVGRGSSVSRASDSASSSAAALYYVKI